MEFETHIVTYINLVNTLLNLLECMFVCFFLHVYRFKGTPMCVHVYTYILYIIHTHTYMYTTDIYTNAQCTIYKGGRGVNKISIGVLL